MKRFLIVLVAALLDRVVTGRWGDGTAGGLNRAAAALGLDGRAFLPYRPAPLVTP